MKMRDILKVADFFTLGNLVFGLLAIFYAINKSFWYAAIFMLIAMLFDFLDGKVARISKKITDQGGQKSLVKTVIIGAVPDREKRERPEPNALDVWARIERDVEDQMPRLMEDET